MESERNVRRTWPKVGFATILFGAVLAVAGTAMAPAGATNHQIQICHATGNEGHYSMPFPTKQQIWEDHGHANPNETAVHPGDIIPPFDAGEHGGQEWGSFDGQNWTAEGQAIWANDCQLPDDPEISIAKTPVDSSVAPGDGIAWDIVVTAGGTGTATGVTVSDTLDDDYTWSENSGDCSITGNVLTCDAGELDSGETFSVRVSATTPAGVCGTVDNSATVDATNIAGSPDGTDAAGNVITINDGNDCAPPPPSVISADLSAALACVDVGFRVTITNAGDAAGEVDVTSDGIVVHDDVTVPIGDDAAVVVAMDEGETYDIDVLEGSDVVRSFAGTRDCVTVGGVVVPAPTPAPRPVPVPVPVPAPVATPDVTPAPQVAGNVAARQLPRTGDDALPLAEVGLGLVLLGAGILLASREELRTA